MSPLRRHWRGCRARAAWEFDRAVRRGIRRYLPIDAMVERAVSERLAAKELAAARDAWFAEQRAKREAERDFSDPRKLVLQRLRVASNERDDARRFAVGGGALAQYVNDPEITDAWMGLK